MDRAHVSRRTIPPSLARLAPAGVLLSLACVAAPAVAQRPTGSQPVTGIQPPVTLSSYAVEVVRIQPSAACQPVVNRPMVVFMVLRNTGATTAAGVPWEMSMTDSRSRQRTVLGQGTLATLARGRLDSIAVVATPTAPVVVLSGTVAPQGPTRANTAPIERLAIDRPVGVFGEQAARTAQGAGGSGGGAGGASTGVAPGHLPLCR